jgi:DNA gyrase subunit A
MLRVNSHQTVFLVSTEGKAAAIHSLAIPVPKNGDQGIAAHKLSPLKEEDVLQGIFSVPMERANLPEAFVLTVSRQGMVKRSALQELPGASANSFVLTKINDGDELFQVLLTNGRQDILITTASGMSIRFNESEIRPMGLVAAGVNGIKLKEGDYVVGISLIDNKDSVALLTRKGLAKRVKAEDYPLQGRYGQGVISWKLAKDDQIVIQTAGKLSDKLICHFRKSASKVFTITNAVERTRAANGQSVFTLKAGDELIGATALDDFSAYWEKA